jgi:hypothetical protein
MRWQGEDMHAPEEFWWGMILKNDCNRLPTLRDAEYPEALFRILTGVFNVKLNENLLLKKEQVQNAV